MLASYQTSIEAYLAKFSIPSPWGIGLMDSITVVSGGLSILFFLLFVLANRTPKSDEKHDRPVRVLVRKAKKSEKKGNYKEAGDLYQAAGHHMEAARMYVKIEDFQSAAQACLQNNDFANAAKCYVRIEDYEYAAELFIKARDYTNAADNLLRIGRIGEAAPLFDKGGHPVKAAECYANVGFHQKAGELLAEAGEYDRAAPFLLRTLQERSSRRDSSLTLEEDAVTGNIAQIASKCFLENGQKLKAAEALELGGRYTEAGSLYEELGEKGKASDLYIRGKDTTSAARVLESSDHADEGALRVAEALLEEGKPVEAAELFSRLGEWNRAAKLFIENDLQDLAVEAYTQHGDHKSAADLLVEMGRLPEAASMFMDAGKPEEAARIYGKLGEKEREIEALVTAGIHYEAGKSLLEIGKKKEATEELQKVDESDSHFQETQHLLGEIFYDQRQWSLAIASYQKALADENVRRDNLDSYYRFATALKEDGQLPGALSFLEKLLLVDYHYRDVKDQVQTIKNVLGSSSPGAAAHLVQSPDMTMVSPTADKVRKSSRYHIIEELGRGGMGVVYKAEDTLLDRIVAYKVLPPQVQKNQKVLDMFLREAKSAARLSHPNIVTIYDADEDRGEFFIIMEMVEGESLKELLQQQGKFPIKTALVLTAQVLKALAYAHGKGIVHRDIKPANLLWAKAEKQVKITDFGLARFIEEGRRTHTQMAGTPYYMSPEQIVGGEVGHLADQYAMGVTLYEFITGMVPFREGDVLYHHVHTEPDPPTVHNPEISPELSDFIMQCMAKDPANRFQDVAAAMDGLKGLLT
jgi:tetratricopeptide (TPR) repeat protein/predicted Ser/Thr protein kinase